MNSFCQPQTPASQLACASQSVTCCLPTQTEQMSALIAIFAQIAGMPIDCPTLEAAAATYSCIPRNQQLPALLYLAAQILSNGSSASVIQVFSGNYGGYPNKPPFSPNVGAAIAFDTSDGSVWNWYSGQWQA